MGILFDPRWKIADPWYSMKYGEYQAFLDSINQTQVMLALWSADGHFQHPWVCEILADANAAQGIHDVIVEQGIHQPENLRTGGFTLHFTMRNDRGRAYHLYVSQKKDSGALVIDEISWAVKGVPYSDYRT